MKIDEFATDRNRNKTSDDFNKLFADTCRLDASFILNNRPKFEVDKAVISGLLV